MAMGVLEIFGTIIITSQHKRQNKYSLKINVFFHLKAEKVENLSIWFQIRGIRVCRQIYAVWYGSKVIFS